MSEIKPQQLFNKRIKVAQVVKDTRIFYLKSNSMLTGDNFVENPLDALIITDREFETMLENIGYPAKESYSMSGIFVDEKPIICEFIVLAKQLYP